MHSWDICSVGLLVRGRLTTDRGRNGQAQGVLGSPAIFDLMRSEDRRLCVLAFQSSLPVATVPEWRTAGLTVINAIHDCSQIYAKYSRGSSVALANKGDDFIRRHRPAEKETLHQIATPAPQIVALLVRFNAFGHDAQDEIVGQADGRIADHGAIGALADLLDEGTVELEQV